MKNIVVIGGGPGGTAAATRAAQLGAKVILIEREMLGGNCMNRNCIPTTGMMRSVELLDRIRRAEVLGVMVGTPTIDLDKARSYVMGVVQELNAGMSALLGSFGIEIIEGDGKLSGPNSVVAEGKTLQADAIILATGAKPKAPPVPVDGLLTTSQALMLNEPPRRLVVWGSGASEVQYAQYFALLGSKVTLIAEGANILKEEDYEIGQRLQGILGENGVQVLTNAQLVSAQKVDSSVRVVVSQRKGQTEILADRVLWAGFEPNNDKLGLETAGIRVAEGKGIAIDAYCQTNVPGIYAIGDVTGPPMYSYVATYQGLLAAENALGKKKKVDLRTMPRCVYTIPEVACVGLSEMDAEEQGYEIEIVNISLASSVRAMTMDEATGGIKVIYEKKNGKLLGVHIVGPRATDLIGEASLGLQMEILAEDFAYAIRGHPTLSESFTEAGRAFYGQALFIPKW